jgi:hypothetical protein
MRISGTFTRDPGGADGAIESVRDGWAGKLGKAGTTGTGLTGAVECQLLDDRVRPRLENLRNLSVSVDRWLTFWPEQRQAKFFFLGYV